MVGFWRLVPASVDLRKLIGWEAGSSSSVAMFEGSLWAAVTEQPMPFSSTADVWTVDADTQRLSSRPS